ncbi:NAD(P)-binding protein [Thozetella sp. PMI_491]|nr:NAD(P)-binding protein [Thozetella sp. PMI_491]
MVRVFITGSSDGIGQAAAQRLSEHGHQVVLHARNAKRAADAANAVPRAAGVLTADLRSMAEIKQLAKDADALGPYDAIIHNAGIGYGATSSTEITADGVSAVFSVNTLATYMLICLMARPKSRLMVMSSDAHLRGNASLHDITQSFSYDDSKVHGVMLANAFARRWGEEIQIVSMHPGWINTKMGGSAAPDELEEATVAIATWAAGEGSHAALKSGTFFRPSRVVQKLPETDVIEKQEQLLKICEDVSGISVPSEWRSI